MVVGGCASVAVALFFPSQTIIAQGRTYLSHKLTSVGRMAVEVYEGEGAVALESFLRRIETISTFRTHLLSDQGATLSGAHLPSGSDDLYRRALQSSTIEITGWTTRLLAAQKIVGQGGRTYVALLVAPEQLKGGLALFLRTHLLRLLAALLASGLTSYLLARYLAAPVRKLKSAVRRFADGDLSTRVSSALGRRKDELADLGRDFDLMAQQIQKLIASHERLIRDIAHELRSPLTRLNVALELLRKQTGEAAKRPIARMDAETAQLNHLIGQLLTLSRLESADLSIETQPVALETMIQRIVQDANFEGQLRGCSVHFTYSHPCTLQADGNLLRSAVENIVRNALRFSPDGSPVQITLSTGVDVAGRHAGIRVQDRGPGVPQDAIDRLFKPFFRTADTPGRPQSGSGLGLSIAHRAVTMHRGAITARNGAERGLIVEIRLPL